MGYKPKINILPLLRIPNFLKLFLICEEGRQSTVCGFLIFNFGINMFGHKRINCHWSQTQLFKKLISTVF